MTGDGNDATPGVGRTDEGAGDDHRAISRMTGRSNGRQLPDKILVASHQACDVGDFQIAQELLRLVEIMLTRKPVLQPAGRRRSMESLVAAHERLWQLRQPQRLE